MSLFLKIDCNNNTHPILCDDGICRNDIKNQPNKRRCLIGYVLCSDLSCQKLYENGILIKDNKELKIAVIKILSDFVDKSSEELNILKLMSNCKYSVKYIDTIEENNNTYIITEKCDSNLREELIKHENSC